ncbi:MAG: OmpA family protein [Desulfobacterales bacterium]|nr:OmpA family protein [Desulfobacterales bacterium]
MKKIMELILIMSFILIFFSLSMASEEDRNGSKDHPLLSRMSDFYISGYKYIEFDSHRFNDQVKKHVIVEGHKYYIEYKLKKGAAEPGELKIRRNIQDALKKIGGNVVFDDNFNKTSTIVLEKDGNETWVEVKSYNNMYRLTTVEKKIMEQDVVANAEVMGNDINKTGHVSIYGIYFDTGKSEIKPESDAAISEIAKLLKNNASLKLHVVGHTDSVGSFDSNMKLSKDRAESVAKSLIGKYEIASNRLKSHGVASLSPVVSNDTDDGKQKNRRVELVKQ